MVAVVPRGLRSKYASGLGALGVQVMTYEWHGNVPLFRGLEEVLA